jgi:sec-independent protein translocase protein TatB
MLDLGWTELLVIGIVALIVVGPKDLPGMFRAVGNFVGKAKRMARDFSKAMNDAADDAGVSDVKKTFDSASNPMKSAMNEVEKSTESFTERTMAGPKKKLDPEREEQAQKIRERSAQMAEERKAREAEDQLAAEPDPDTPADTADAVTGEGTDTATAAPGGARRTGPAGDKAKPETSAGDAAEDGA